MQYTFCNSFFHLIYKEKYYTYNIFIIIIAPVYPYTQYIKTDNMYNKILLPFGFFFV